jgi:branched-chain amino acid transport system permease protein
MSLVFFLNLAISGLVQGLVIALAALAINLTFAVARFPNVATGEFLTVGAYAGIGLQKLGVSSVPLAGLGAAAVTGAVVLCIFRLAFRPLLRRPVAAPLIASIGLTFVIRYAISYFVGHDQYSFAMRPMRASNIAGVRTLPIDLYLGGVALVTLAAVFAFLHRTAFGQRMRAVADNPELARASGIRVGQVMTALWITVGMICGIGGVILGVKTIVVPEIGWNILLPAFAAAILGGVGSLGGAVLAGLLLGVVQEVSTPFVGFTYKLAISFVVLALVLAFRPQGLFGLADRVR